MKKLNIRIKLYMMILPLEAVIVALTLFCIFTARSVSTESKSLYYEQLYTANSTLVKADRDFYQAYTALFKYNTYLPYVPADVVRSYSIDYYSSLANTQERVQAVYDLACKFPKMMEFEFDGHNIKKEFDEFNTNYGLLKQSYDIGYESTALEQFDAYFKAAQQNIANMEELIEEYAKVSGAELQVASVRRILATIAIVAVVFIVLNGFIIYMVGYVRKGIVSVANDINRIAEKDLAFDVREIQGEDEIAALTRSAIRCKEEFTRMIDTLNETSGVLLESSNRLASSTEDTANSMESIENATGELAHTASQQAEDTTRIASEMSDIDGITKESIENTASLAKACADMEQITDNGMKTVNTLTNITKQSMEAFNNIFDAIRGIDEKTQTIGAASDMISNIAMQTNLLSLNASIEAARAGDAGRGFAVVADEIRKLAEQSAESVNTINSMIEELYKSANDAKTQSDLVKEYVQKQERSVEDTKEGFDAIVSNISIINSGVDVLKDVNNLLGDKVNLIVGVVESLSASAEETAATAEELNATTASVNEGVSGLKQMGENVTSSANDIDAIVSEFKL